MDIECIFKFIFVINHLNSDSVKCSEMNISKMSLNGNVCKSADELNFSRSPLLCPVTNCKKFEIFLSDYGKHVICDHAEVRNEYVSPGESKTFQLKPLDFIDENHCQMVLMVADKIR